MGQKEIERSKQWSAKARDVIHALKCYKVGLPSIGDGSRVASLEKVVSLFPNTSTSALSRMLQPPYASVVDEICQSKLDELDSYGMDMLCRTFYALLPQPGGQVYTAVKS